ncbi:MAG: dTDP-4-dehydrorhamnose 3,5-epimerase [Herpetosiphonaceae bacterium]|nr:dTDP-4-dehydrorhamnose 3,5-epimerase [Herpetosiphonaceae bacterium]
MEVIRTKLDGVVVLKPQVFPDVRGFFTESYNQRTMDELGINTVFVQDNHSRSIRHTLRGMHYQVNGGQAKLLRCAQGEIFDVAVDLREGSPTFGQWFGQTLSAENFLQMYVPVGFAHGFCVLSETADLLYKCTSYYSPKDERGLAWNDPTVGITWPITEPILSARDQHHPRLGEATTFPVGHV